MGLDARKDNQKLGAILDRAVWCKQQAWGEYWTKVLEYKYKYLKNDEYKYKYKYWIFKSTWVQVQVLWKVLEYKYRVLSL